jgi:hypothetical protein
MGLAAHVERFSGSAAVIRAADGTEVVVEVPWGVSRIEVGMPVSLVAAASDQATDPQWEVEWELPRHSHRAA